MKNVKLIFFFIFEFIFLIIRLIIVWVSVIIIYISILIYFNLIRGIKIFYKKQL